MGLEPTDISMFSSLLDLVREARDLAGAEWEVAMSFFCTTALAPRGVCEMPDQNARSWWPEHDPGSMILMMKHTTGLFLFVIFYLKIRSLYFFVCLFLLLQRGHLGNWRTNIWPKSSPRFLFSHLNNTVSTILHVTAVVFGTADVLFRANGVKGIFFQLNY